MSAKILLFPFRHLPAAKSGAPAPLGEEWCEHHRPLIVAAIDLLSADDAEFERRCQLMAAEDGASILVDLSGQLDRLASHIADVANALSMTAMRIRATMARMRELPA